MKESHKQLNTEEYFRILMDYIPDYIYFKDRESKFTLINKAHAEGLGLDDPIQAIGRNDADYFDANHAEQAYKEEQEMMKNGKTVLNRIEYIKTAKGHRYVSTSKVPIINPAGVCIGLVGISRDETEKELAKQEESNAKEKAIQADKAKSLFFANMSHEIRTPMNGVIGMADILMQTELSYSQRNYLDAIIKSGETLLAVINDILDFSKIESGNLVLEAIPISIRSLVEDVSDIQVAIAEKKSIDLITFIDPKIPLYVAGDYIRLRQIITNLVNNAIKFTDKGEVYIQVEYAGLTKEGHKVCFSIKDTGIGIASENQKKLFKHFSQVDDSTTRRYGGTGLGLSICHSLVDKMGGKLKVKSQQNKGSIFYFSAVFGTSPEENGVYLNLNNISLNKLTVLVVDDNDMNRKVLSEYLKLLGVATIREVEGGKQALEEMHLLKNAGTPANIVLIDYQMPDMDGVQLSNQIKKDVSLQSSQLVLLSSVSTVFPTYELKNMGFEYCLNKPIKVKLLFNILASIVDSSKLVSNENEKKKEDDKANEFKECSFLIAEDNEVNMRVVQLILKRISTHIYTARNGNEAIDVFLDKKPDFILMDMQMPHKNGIEATIEIRKIEQQQQPQNPVRIIALTANTMQEDVEKCINSGMNAFLKKPFKADDLMGIIRELK